MLHVFGADVTSAGRNALAARSSSTHWKKAIIDHQVWLGPRSKAETHPGWAGTAPTRYIHDPLGLGRSGLAWHQAAGWLDEVEIVHCWSVNALPWVLANLVRLPAAERPPLLIDVDPEVAADVCGRVEHARESLRITYLCPTAIVQQQLLARGAPLRETVLLRSAVDYRALRAANRAAARTRLSINRDEHLTLILPPISPAGGAMLGVWGAAVAQKVYDSIRIVVPGQTREARRMKRLITAIEYHQVARFAPFDLSLADLVNAADLAVFAPAGPTGVEGLEAALAAGTPVVGTAVPAVTEYIAQGYTGWLAPKPEPAGVAKRIVEALENTEQSLRQAETARSQAFRVFRRHRYFQQLQQVYENVRTGRPADADIVDPALSA